MAVSLVQRQSGKAAMRAALRAAPVAQRSCSHTIKANATPNWTAVGFGAAAAAAAACTTAHRWRCAEAETLAVLNDGVKRYTYDEMKAMCKAGRIVVAYRGDVYDVSDFSGHPGGVGRLQMASGGDLEVFWRIYTQHNRGHITEDVMKDYKIGRLSDADMKKVTSETFYDASAYDSDPELCPDLLTNTRYPYNAEGRLSLLTESWQTPYGRHFVRNHNAVPEIDPQEYLLTVNGSGVDETIFTLEDLKTKFQKHDVTTVIQCNGNRREDYHYIDGETPAFGPPHWVAGAIGNATWSGPRLRDVLKASGMDVDAISLRDKEPPANAAQVGLTGYDQDEVGNQYCCSFPFDKALDPFGDVIVAYEMNGHPIPRHHGYPVRCIVPGHAGARNCKFLQHIQITDSPCSCNCNWKQYAVHAPDVELKKIAEFDNHHAELMLDPAVQEMPVQSMITSPGAGDILSAVKSGFKAVKVKGIAWGGAGSGVNRVDVTLDNGKNFTSATMVPNPIEQKRRSQFAWRFFEKDVPIPDDIRQKLQNGQDVELVLASKALNASWNVQPENADANVNAHGCCVNHWYRVPVTLSPTVRDDIKAPEGDFANKPSGGRFARPFRNLDHPTDAEQHKEAQHAAIAKLELCTCGCGCAAGTGCLGSRFDSSPSKLYERRRNQEAKKPSAAAP